LAARKLCTAKYIIQPKTIIGYMVENLQLNLLQFYK
jgi:hypothetical protein